MADKARKGPTHLISSWISWIIVYGLCLLPISETFYNVRNFVGYIPQIFCRQVEWWGVNSFHRKLAFSLKVCSGR